MPKLVHERTEVDALEPGTVVRSEAGTIACRFDGTRGVVFGDERPFPWSALALPVRVLWAPDGSSDPEPNRQDATDCLACAEVPVAPCLYHEGVMAGAAALAAHVRDALDGDL